MLDVTEGKEKIKIRCRVQMRISPTKSCKCLDYGHTSETGQGPNRKTACHRCGQLTHQAKNCNESENCVLYKVRGASGESVADTAGSARGSLFRAELETNRTRLACSASYKSVRSGALWHLNLPSVWDGVRLLVLTQSSHV